MTWFKDYHLPITDIQEKKNIESFSLYLPCTIKAHYESCQLYMTYTYHSYTFLNIYIGKAMKNLSSRSAGASKQRLLLFIILSYQGCHFSADSAVSADFLALKVIFEISLDPTGGLTAPPRPPAAFLAKFPRISFYLSGIPAYTRL